MSTTVSFVEFHVGFVDTGKDEVNVNMFSFFLLFFFKDFESLTLKALFGLKISDILPEPDF